MSLGKRRAVPPWMWNESKRGPGMSIPRPFPFKFPSLVSYRRRFYDGPKSSGSTYTPRRWQKLNVEKKFFDTAISFTVDATGEVPATGQLNLIPQGTTESQRVGRIANLKSIQLRLQIKYAPAADTVGSDVVYLFLVQDKQCNGAATTAATVLTSTNFYEAMVNMANSDRFRIMARWALPVQSQAGVSAAYAQDVKALDMYRKINIPIEFDASVTTGAITSIRSNNLFLLAGTGNNTDDEVAINGTCRLRFTDL